MDWKREAADELRNYMNRKAAIANISDQIADLATEITSIRSTLIVCVLYLAAFITANILLPAAIVR